MKDRQIKEQRDGSKPDVKVNALNAQEWNDVSQGQKNLVLAAQLSLSPVNAAEHDNTQLAQAVDLCGNYGWRDQSVVPNRIELVPYNPSAVISKDYALHDGRYFTFKPNRTNTGDVYVSLSDVDGSPLGNKPLLSKNFNLLPAEAIRQNVDVTMQYLHSVDINGAFVITAFASVDEDGNLVGGGGEGVTLDHNKLDGLQGGNASTNEFRHITQSERDKWNNSANKTHNQLSGLQGGNASLGQYMHVSANDINKLNHIDGTLIAVLSSSYSAYTIQENGFYSIASIPKGMYVGDGENTTYNGYFMLNGNITYSSYNKIQMHIGDTVQSYMSGNRGGSYRGELSVVFIFKH